MGSIRVDDPAPRNAALELTGNPSLTTGTAFGTAFDEGFYYSPTASLLRGIEQQESRQGEIDPRQQIGRAPPRRLEPTSPLLDQKEANEIYGVPGELTFDKPVRKAEAELLSRWKRDELKRANVLGRADPGFLPGAARLAGGFLGSAVDPLNIASAFVPVVGEARFAALAGRLGLTGSRLARGALEGAAGAAMVEPIILLQAQSQQADYDAYDSLLNLAFGTALGGGLHAGFGKISDWIRGQPIELRETALRGAVAAIAEDRPVAVAELFGPTRAALMDSTSLSTTGPRFAPEPEAVPDAPRAPDAPQGDDIALPATGKDGTIKIYQTEAQAQKAVKNARRQGQELAVEPQPDGTYRLVEPARVEIKDTYIEARAAENAVKRLPPAEREGITVVPRIQPDGSVRYAIVSGLTPAQAEAVKANPAVLDRLGHTPTEPPPRAPARPTAVMAEQVRAAQRMTYQPTPTEAAQAKNIDTLAEGWDQPITPEQGAEEAAELIDATNEMVQSAKKAGDLDDRDMATIEGDPEAEKMTKGRAAAYQAASACLARVA